jgi:hypothetical protein
MYTFRVESAERTFRVVKLVLPHPVLENRACAIRFIFSCQGTVQTFFSHVPLLDDIVRSFAWCANPDTLDDDVIAGAQARFGRR